MSAWTAFARGWAACLIVTWVWRASSLVETRSTSGVIAQGALQVTQKWPITPGQAWGLWVILMAGAVVTAAAPASPRWLTRVGILAAGGAALVLGLEEALNLKAYDRLLTWQALALLAASFGSGTAATGDAADEDPRTAAGFGRYALLIIYAGLYGSTGWLKALFEPTWWNGETLTGFLVDTSFGQRPLGVLASGHPWLLAPSGWLTLAFEATFPLLVWWRPARRVLLVLGAAMHLGIFALMNVGPFSLIALAGYPLLLGQRDGFRFTAWVAQKRLLTPIGLASAAWASALALPLATPWVMPRDEALFRVPDPDVRASIIAALTDPESHPLRTGEHGRHSFSAPANPKTAGERAAIAVLKVLGERDAKATLSLVDLASRTETPSPPKDEVFIASLGRMSVVPGTQRWPGAWGWILPDLGDFVTLKGDARWLEPCLVAAGVPVVDTHWVLGGDEPTLTDTGGYRQPAREPGTPDVELLDVSGLARIVAGIEGCL